MPNSLPNSAVSAHRELPEKSGGQAKVHTTAVRKAETVDAWRGQVGAAIERMRGLVGWSLKELAAAIGRDERQIARWISGDERPQFDALFAVAELRQPLVIALSELAGGGVEIETTIRIKRIA